MNKKLLKLKSELKDISIVIDDNSSVKWGHLARNGVGLFQIFNHVKTIKNN